MTYYVISFHIVSYHINHEITSHILIISYASTTLLLRNICTKLEVLLYICMNIAYKINKFTNIHVAKIKDVT